jgi:hypothetical protein
MSSPGRNLCAVAGVRRRSMFGMIGSKHVGMAHSLSLCVGLQIFTKEVHRAGGINGHRYRISNYAHSAITVALGENRTLQSGFQHVRSTNASIYQGLGCDKNSNFLSRRTPSAPLTAMERPAEPQWMAARIAMGVGTWSPIIMGTHGEFWRKHETTQATV